MHVPLAVGVTCSHLEVVSTLCTQGMRAKRARSQVFDWIALKDHGNDVGESLGGDHAEHENDGSSEGRVWGKTQVKSET
jgi:hypothetical protein